MIHQTGSPTAVGRGRLTSSPSVTGSDAPFNPESPFADKEGPSLHKFSPKNVSFAINHNGTAASTRIAANADEPSSSLESEPSASASEAVDEPSPPTVDDSIRRRSRHASRAHCHSTSAARAPQGGNGNGDGVSEANSAAGGAADCDQVDGPDRDFVKMEMSVFVVAVIVTALFIVVEAVGELMI